MVKEGGKRGKFTNFGRVSFITLEHRKKHIILENVNFESLVHGVGNVVEK